MTDPLHILFDADCELINLGGYSLSTLELLANVLGMWSYVEIIRRKLRGLVLGVIASLVLASLFYQLRLYSDMGLMGYYAAASLVALVFWRRSFKKEHAVQITRLGRRARWMLIAGLPLVIGVLAFTAARLHLWLPALFPESARVPLGDAITTVLGVTASILVIRRKAECMALWLAADLLSCFIYSHCGVYFLAGVYIAYVLIDAAGLFTWLRRSQPATSPQATPVH